MRVYLWCEVRQQAIHLQVHFSSSSARSRHARHQPFSPHPSSSTFPSAPSSLSPSVQLRPLFSRQDGGLRQSDGEQKERESIDQREEEERCACLKQGVDCSSIYISSHRFHLKAGTAGMNAGHLISTPGFWGWNDERWVCY